MLSILLIIFMRSLPLLEPCGEVTSWVSDLTLVNNLKAIIYTIRCYMLKVAFTQSHNTTAGKQVLLVSRHTCRAPFLGVAWWLGQAADVATWPIWSINTKIRKFQKTKVIQILYMSHSFRSGWADVVNGIQTQFLVLYMKSWTSCPPLQGGLPVLYNSISAWEGGWTQGWPTSTCIQSDERGIPPSPPTALLWGNVECDYYSKLGASSSPSLQILYWKLAMLPALAFQVTRSSEAANLTCMGFRRYTPESGSPECWADKAEYAQDRLFLPALFTKPNTLL